jgi:glycerol uptake facilitator-like aquaporin
VCIGPPQWFSEWVAAFGLVLTILLTLRAWSEAVAMAVGLYITAAYWFTASTSFADPAATIAPCILRHLCRHPAIDAPLSSSRKWSGRSPLFASAVR